MIRINLLPHREMRRERRKREFVGLAVASALAAGLVTFGVGAGIDRAIDTQAERNALLRSENARLDGQIKEIANLRAEIDGLKARQQAVENLQSDRTMPVHLLDELVRFTPDGLFLRQVRQDELKVTLTGYAQSNERVSELLRNLAYASAWLEKPELGEIKLATLPASAQGAPGAARDGKRAYEFTLNALLKRPERAAPADKAPSMAGAGRPAEGAVAAPLAAAPPVAAAVPGATVAPLANAAGK